MRFEPFKLKELLVGSRGAMAAHHLSESYSETLSAAELFGDDPGKLAEMNEHSLGYPGLRGSAELREAIAEWHPGLEARHVLPANGSDDSFFALAAALLSPGDRVVVQSPVYPGLLAVPRAMGCQVELLQCQADRNWAFDHKELEELLRDKKNGGVKLLVLTNPHNPTGYVMRNEELRAVLDLAGEHGALVLSDEVFRGLHFQPGADPLPAASLAEHALSMASVSKTLGMPGLRVGWIATRHEATLAALARVQSYMNSFISVPGEILATAALRRREAILGRNRAIAQNNLALLDSFFAKYSATFRWVRPHAGTVALVEYLGGSASAFSEALLDYADTMLIPSTYFDFGDRHFRFGFATRGMATALTCLESFVQARVEQPIS